MVWSSKSRKSLPNPILDWAWHLWEEEEVAAASTIPTEAPMATITGTEAMEIPTLPEAGLATEVTAAEAGGDSTSTEELKAVLREALLEAAREAELGQEEGEEVAVGVGDGEAAVAEAVPDTIPTEETSMKNLNVEYKCFERYTALPEFEMNVTINCCFLSLVVKFGKSKIQMHAR